MPDRLSRDEIPLYSLAFDRDAFERCNERDRRGYVHFVNRLQSYGFLLPKGKPDKELAFIDLHRYDSFAGYVSECKNLYKGAALRQANKALRKGYYCKFFDEKTFIPDIVAIDTSASERQGRRLPMHYFRTVDERGGYPLALDAESAPTNSFAWIRLFGLFRENIGHTEGDLVVNQELLAYIRLRRCGEFALYATILGHADHLREGIMYLMQLELVRQLLEGSRLLADSNTSGVTDNDESMHGLRYVFYGRYLNQGEGLLMWKKKLLFTPGFFELEAPTSDAPAA